MATSLSTEQVDQNGLKTGQALTILLLLLAFVINNAWIVAAVALSQLLGAADVPFAPYRLFYRKVIRASGLVKPRVEPDHMPPHRFAMLVGALFNGVAFILLLAGAPIIAWGLVWIVIVLANLNFWLNFCLGCWMYFQLNRLGIPGFNVPVKE